MKYFALALCFMLVGCGESTKSGPAPSQSDMPAISHGEYRDGLSSVVYYSLVCIDGITYIVLGNGISPKYTSDMRIRIQTCEQ